MKFTNALVVKLVDTKDLNPCRLRSASSSLAEGTIDYMNGIKIISDQNKKSLKIKLLLKAKIEKHNFKKENLLIVVGGDGFMLQTLKKYKDLSKKFYGINSGN